MNPRSRIPCMSCAFCAGERASVLEVLIGIDWVSWEVIIEADRWRDKWMNGEGEELDV